MIVIMNDGRAVITTRRSLSKLRAEQFSPDWENPDTRVGIEFGLSYSKARAMVDLKRRSSDMSSQALWAAMNPTARTAAFEYISGDSGARQVQARWAELAEEQQPKVDALQAAIAANSDRIQALERTVRKHAAGVKSEWIRVHGQYMRNVLSEFGYTEFREYEAIPDFDLGGFWIGTDGMATTPASARAKFAEEYPKARELGIGNAQNVTCDEYVEARVASRYRGTHQLHEMDTVDFFRTGKKHPEYAQAFIAPMSLTDAQADVYETFRRDGLSPAKAEQAALAVVSA